MFSANMKMIISLVMTLKLNVFVVIQKPEHSTYSQWSECKAMTGATEVQIPPQTRNWLGNLGPVILSHPNLPYQVTVREKMMMGTTYATLTSLEEGQSLKQIASVLN